MSKGLASLLPGKWRLCGAFTILGLLIVSGSAHSNDPADSAIASEWHLPKPPFRCRITYTYPQGRKVDDEGGGSTNNQPDHRPKQILTSAYPDAIRHQITMMDGSRREAWRLQYISFEELPGGELSSEVFDPFEIFNLATAGSSAGTKTEDGVAYAIYRVRERGVSGQQVVPKTPAGNHLELWIHVATRLPRAYVRNNVRVDFEYLAAPSGPPQMPQRLVDTFKQKKKKYEQKTRRKLPDLPAAGGLEE